MRLRANIDKGKIFSAPAVALILSVQSILHGVMPLHEKHEYEVKNFYIDNYQNYQNFFEIKFFDKSISEVSDHIIEKLKSWPNFQVERRVSYFYGLYSGKSKCKSLINLLVFYKTNCTGVLCRILVVTCTVDNVEEIVVAREISGTVSVPSWNSEIVNDDCLLQIIRVSEFDGPTYIVFRPKLVFLTKIEPVVRECAESSF